MKGYGKFKIEESDTALFTSDMHMHHDGIIQHCGRPFRDASDMNESLIRNWNSAVPQDGIVFVLGDMFWKASGADKCEKIMRRFNGRKFLVAGNHDLFSKERYLDMGFEEAWDYLEVSVQHQTLVCSHYPMFEWNGFYKGWMHLHGHTHHREPVDYEKSGGHGRHFSARVYNVGVDANQYAPVLLDAILRKLESGMKTDEENMARRGDTKKHQPYSF